MLTNTIDPSSLSSQKRSFDEIEQGVNAFVDSQASEEQVSPTYVPDANLAWSLSTYTKKELVSIYGRYLRHDLRRTKKEIISLLVGLNVTLPGDFASLITTENVGVYIT
jgi:hypothetical protein